MKTFLVGFLAALVLIFALFVWLHILGRSPRHPATADDDRYREALRQSALLAANPPQLVWVDNVKKAFHPFTVENVSVHFPEAYAETCYFRDAFHRFDDRKSLTAYMIKSAEISPGVLFEFGEPVLSGIDVYLPWVMILPGSPAQRSLGLSHLRFNAEGQVIFHQDYWDSADVLIPRVPVANGLIELVRRRLQN